MCEADPECDCDDGQETDQDSLCEWCGEDNADYYQLCSECAREREYHKTTQEELKLAKERIEELQKAFDLLHHFIGRKQHIDT